MEIKYCDDAGALHRHSEFPIGVAVDMTQLDNNQEYRKIVIQQFNSITPENIFKATYLHPDENNFEWSEANKLVEFCKNSNKRLHGSLGWSTL